MKKSFDGLLPIAMPTLERSNLKCDICDKPTDSSDLFALTTKQVVLNMWYWEYIFTHNQIWIPLVQAHVQAHIKSKPLSKDDDKKKVMFGSILALSSVDEPWGVCEECIESLFQKIDKHKAKEYTRAYFETKCLPPDSGPADIDEVLKCVAQAFYCVELDFPKAKRWWQFWK